jgi:AcrR family transcriptional regulator
MYGVSREESKKPATGPIWTRPEPGRRKPRFTREQIAAAAMAIADAEGLDALTMRRVAEELGAGTMTIYHYVRSKDDLIALVLDQMIGELLIPDGEMPGDWRDAFTAIARRSRAAFGNHVWIHELMARSRPEDAQIGSNGLRHFEQSLGAAALTGVSPEDQLELLAFVDDYVFGYCLREREEQLSGPGAEGAAEIYEAISDYVADQVSTGEFPRVEALLAGRSPLEFLEETYISLGKEDRFERGLRRVLDGIALDLERRG